MYICTIVDNLTKIKTVAAAEERLKYTIIIIIINGIKLIRCLPIKIIAFRRVLIPIRDYFKV